MKFLRQLSTLIAVSFCAAGIAHAQMNLKEGEQYVVMSKPQPVESGKKIEVIEFFSFGCHHCRDLEPHLEGWIKNMPANVSFKRVPVMFAAEWENLGRIYYTLDALGEMDKHASGVFDAVHREGKKMNNKEVFYAWAAAKGLDAAKVKAAYEGFAVDSKLRRAGPMVKAYGIESVPTIIVDGKYSTGPSLHKGSHAAIPDAINFLVTKAAKERK